MQWRIKWTKTYKNAQYRSLIVKIIITIQDLFVICWKTNKQKTRPFLVLELVENFAALSCTFFLFQPSCHTPASVHLGITSKIPVEGYCARPFSWASFVLWCPDWCKSELWATAPGVGLSPFHLPGFTCKVHNTSLQRKSSYSDLSEFGKTTGSLYFLQVQTLNPHHGYNEHLMTVKVSWQYRLFIKKWETLIPNCCCPIWESVRRNSGVPAVCEYKLCY